MEPNILRLFGFGFEGTEVPDEMRTLLAQGLGAIILFKRNFASVEQICRLTMELHQNASEPLLVGVDQEGGRVVRMPTSFFAPPAAAVLGRRGDPAMAAEVAHAVGRQLLACGINWNLAPVLDVHTNPANPVIGDRAYGTDPALVARMGVAALRGFTEAGVLCTGKHFPGHGDTVQDSHLSLPRSGQSATRWREVEFLPFRTAIAAGMPSVMVAHLDCPALDPIAPTSLSRTVITGILRGELGFTGMVVSDDMEMSAIAANFDAGEAAVRFVEAGGDLILICRGAARQHAAVAAVSAALRSGRLSDARITGASARIAAARRCIRPIESIEPEAVRKMLVAEGPTLLARVQTISLEGS